MVDEPFETAVRAHESGDLPGAERLYRTILSTTPDDAEVAYLLTLVLLDTGRAAEALPLLREVVRRQPDHAAGWLALGRALLLTNQAATLEVRRALELDPSLAPDAEPLLATALLRHGVIAEAIEVIVRMQRAGRALDDALVEAAIDGAERLHLLAPAVELLEARRRIRPRDGSILGRLAVALLRQRRPVEAAEVLREAVSLMPDSVTLRSNLGTALADQGRPEEAIAEFDAALTLERHPEVEFNRARALGDLWRQTEELAGYRSVLARTPGHAGAISNLLFGLNYLDDIDGEMLRSEHVSIAAGLRGSQAILAKADSIDRQGPIRVGFVSADLREHAVATFLEPLLEHLDSSRVSAIAFPTRLASDHVVDRVRTRFVEWHPIDLLSDDEAARLVRDCGVEVLIDLGGHTAHNRLAVFVRRPAPVQVTWLGYPNTTGLREIDWRIVDEVTDPPGSEGHMVEKPLRIEAPFLCHRPAGPPPERAPRMGGPIRFGSFNKLAKASPRCIAVWAAVLRASPGSTLTMKTQHLRSEVVRRRVESAFADHSIPPDRLRLLPATSSMSDHLRLYQSIDIALDSFPYHGTTTTCEAMWSGVPVVTLMGSEHRSRVGATLLGAVGFPDLIARSEQEFVSIATRLAADPDRLADFHAFLGRRMVASPLCDGAAFARRFEKAMWSISRR